MKLSKFAKKTMRVLIDASKNDEILTYGEVAIRLGQPGAVRCLSAVLGNISEYTYKQLGIFLSVIVVNQESMIPGPGFIGLVNKVLEIDLNIDSSFSQQHTKTVHSVDTKELDKLMLVATY